MSNKNSLRIDFMKTFIEQNMNVAELGVWKGDLSSLLLSTFKPNVLTLIDPWRFDSTKPFSWYGGSFAKSQNDMDDIYRFVVKRFSREIELGKVQVTRGTLGDANIQSVDLLYVDGDHSFEGVSKDIDLAILQMKKGAIIVFDDFGVSGWWENGVTIAVTESMQSGRLSLLDSHGTQIACQIL